MDVIVKGRRSIDFKDKSYLQGQTIRDMPEKEALRLIGKGHVEPAAGDDGVIAETEPPEKMTVPELKDLLDKLEVEYASDAKKAELLELVKKHTGEPPAE
ncbi:HeH/LEM domain-containing protein [uncultured Desulfosarcina sp.]|uniref:HeH/LEM domain-containing protein n=1 Tax=uncultured Desulfosarcina sp. TaxID=218289 RepID=UPI0029C80557|nr:HeH/LEM domain-containing protein [uncultured Desulfosarcina sp.]